MHDRRPIRPVGAALRSMLVPGWGQIAAGLRWPGRTLVALSSLGLALTVGTALFLGIGEVLARLADPDVLFLVLVLNVVVAVARIVVTAHAWISAGGRSIVLAVALSVVVIAPHALVAHVTSETRSTLLTVFAAAEPSVPDEVTTATVAPPPSDSATTPESTTTTASADTPHQEVEPEIPTTSTTLPDPVDGRYNVLLLGGDAGPGRSGLRTDAIVLVSVDLASGDTAMFGIPRNWGGLRLSDGRRLPGLILNEVYEWGRTHPAGFDPVDPGAAAVVDVVEVITRVDIDHVVLVDITGFASVVDALGGLTIDVPRAVYGPRYEPATGGYHMIWIPRGQQHLDGATALAYIRERYQSSDYDRMDRQRCVLAGLLRSVDAPSLLAGLDDVLDAVERHVTTDIPIDHLPALIRLSQRVDPDLIRVIRFDQGWAGGWTSEGYAIADSKRVSDSIRTTITDPEAGLATVAGTAAGSCG